MTKILNIDTATGVCSVAISEGKNILASRESREGKNHSLLLAPFIDESLKECGIKAAELSAISISKGPGSYTGLRIGVSTAKGMAYALSVPLIAIGTLKVMAKAYINRNPGVREEKSILICPMIDARRMEVFSGFYRTDLSLYREIQADIVEEEIYDEFLKENNIIFIGDGATKCRQVITHPRARFDERYSFSASDMAELSAEKFKSESFENIAYFEPFYLKDFVPTIPKKRLI